MSAGEQTFLMAELARLKREGRIEVIRERNANFHVFVFLNGTRPNDELIAASLEKATLEEPTRVASKTSHVKTKPAKGRGELRIQTRCEEPKCEGSITRSKVVI